MRPLSNKHVFSDGNMKPVRSSSDNLKQKILSRRKEMEGCLKKWYVRYGIEYPWRQTRNPYRVLVSEMLLQRTRASNVVPVYIDFIKRFPTIKSLSMASVRELERFISTLGIKSRSVKMKSVAEKLVHDYSGKIPSDEENLLVVLGPGSRYTINAVRCFAMGKRVPIFDVNVKRIFGRMFSIVFTKESHKNSKTWEIVSYALPEDNVNRFNWALLDLGKTICTPNNPKCEECPLKSICDYGSRF